ncbi:MAG: hypothetical protein IKJ76_00200, partial [Fibrobacter sp.]|nr:hypothetical protein [Fibrobacter sp.]
FHLGYRQAIKGTFLFFCCLFRFVCISHKASFCLLFGSLLNARIVPKEIFGFFDKISAVSKFDQVINHIF